MATAAKIILKNTTKVSLNARFTGYREQTQTAASIYRQKLQAQRQASVENVRLAQQMANRPTVIAALRLKKRSLQQRLGRKSFQGGTTNVKSRLDLGAGPSTARFRNLTTFKNTRGRNFQFRLRGRGQPYRSNFNRPGTSPLIKARLGAPSTDGKFGKFNYQKLRGGFNMRRNFGRGASRGRNMGTRNTVPNIRRGIANRRGQPANRNRQPVPTKQELDNQLDEYMAETKSPMHQFLQNF